VWGESWTSSHRKHLKSTVSCVAVSPLFFLVCFLFGGRAWPTAGGKCLCRVCLKHGRRKTKRCSTAHRFEQRDSSVLASVHLLSFLKNHYTRSCGAFSFQLVHDGMHIAKKGKILRLHICRCYYQAWEYRETCFSFWKDLWQWHFGICSERGSRNLWHTLSNNLWNKNNLSNKLLPKSPWGCFWSVLLGLMGSNLHGLWAGSQLTWHPTEHIQMCVCTSTTSSWSLATCIYTPITKEQWHESEKQI
jgi:hypothetical protein